MASPEWRVMIADDEPVARRGVRQLLAPFTAFRVVSECRNGAEVLAQLDAVAPQVLFLDVQMPGIDGFEVIRRRGSARMPLVVFLTAYDEFALKAFDAQALDYLVKPVTAARFAIAMARLTRLLHGAAVAAPRLSVPTARGVLLLELPEIEWIESADNYARVWAGGRGYLLRESLDALEVRVGAHGFVRTHRQALVRVSAIRKLTRADDGATLATLSSGARVPISRRRRAMVLAAIRSAGAPAPGG